MLNNFKNLVIIGSWALVASSSVAFAGNTLTLEVGLRVSSPSGKVVSVNTTPGSPVEIQFGLGEPLAFVVEKVGESLEVRVLDPNDKQKVFDIRRAEPDRVVTVSGYAFEVIGTRAVSSVRDLTPPATE